MEVTFQYPLFRIVDCFSPKKASTLWRMYCFNIRSFGSWIASNDADGNLIDNLPFQYPLFRIVDCFCRQLGAMWLRYHVSISALSDRGLLRYLLRLNLQVHIGFNIRSFGSWIASRTVQERRHGLGWFQYPLFRIVDCFPVAFTEDSVEGGGFNIRSFGSWIASKPPDCHPLASGWFQYPLFRIVDCFATLLQSQRPYQYVSISALSDRGLLPCPNSGSLRQNCRFNIRSFGSWIASPTGRIRARLFWGFQYPLFRIVDCFMLSLLAVPTAGACFNIRSFGSWIASDYHQHVAFNEAMFQYPLFRIVDCFPPANGSRIAPSGVSISALSDRGLLPVCLCRSALS